MRRGTDHVEQTPRMRATRTHGSILGMTDRLRITILGAGFAGLETAFLLRMRLRDRAAITLVSQREAFTFRPNAIYVPFGADPADLVVDLAKPFHRRDVDFVQDTVTGVDPEAHEVQLEKGRSVAYDKLVIATGAGMSPDEIPGLERARRDDLDPRRACSACASASSVCAMTRGPVRAAACCSWSPRTTSARGRCMRS